MKTHHPVIRVLLMGILAGLLVASAGMASAGRLGFFRISAESPTVRHESTTCAPDDEGTADDEGTSDDQGTTDDEGTSDDQGTAQDEGTSEDEGSEDESPSEECEEPEEGDGTTVAEEGDDGTAPPQDPEDREAECNEAAGIETGEGSATEGSETTGLDHAIEVVLANCLKNPQAPGLVNALRHLVANRDRHMLLDAEKAARQAAREAAKAARHGAHGKGPG